MLYSKTILMSVTPIYLFLRYCFPCQYACVHTSRHLVIALACNIVMAMYNEELCPARICFFAKVNVIVNGASVTKILACLEWYQQNTKKDWIAPAKY